ncbi:MAG: hypothetical protein EOM59_14255 [Clostridia bacterium]|jgi:hypothetical protein|nr:hypothetical protein [Clostridia bacterium]
MAEEMEQLYVISTRVSSEFKIEKSEVLSDKEKKITWLYEKEMRNKIHSIRAMVYGPRERYSLNFYKLRLVNDEGKTALKEAYSKVNLELKEIDPSLKAEIEFMPLDISMIAKGNLYEQIIGSIKYQVFSKIFQRIDSLTRDGGKDNLPANTKKSLKNLVEHCRNLNVTRDEDIDLQIEKIAKMIEEEALIPLRDDLQKMLKSGEGRFYALEV